MLQVLNDRIVVLPDPPETVTEGGIALPDTAVEKPISGTVVLGPFLDKKVYYPDFCAMTILSQKKPPGGRQAVLC